MSVSDAQQLSQQISQLSVRARELGTVSMTDTRMAAAVLYRSLLGEEQLAALITQAKQDGVSLASVLSAAGVLSADSQLEIQAIASGLPFIQLEPGTVGATALMLLKPETARLHQAVPISVSEQDGTRTITIALANPASAPARQALEQLFAADGSQVRFVAAHPDRIDQVLRTRYDALGDDGFEEIDEGEEGTAEELMDEEHSGPARQYYANIFQEAVARGASDVHFEISPDNRNMLVRMRVDGVMHELTQVPERFRRALLAVIKLDMDLDVADERRLKNGRVTKKISGREVDFRGANWVTTRGEELVVRLLDREGVRLDIAQMGYSQHNMDRLRQGYESSFGAIVVCGPTGSGKSSTLYAVLKEISTPERCVLTIEDPVEFRMPGVQQAQVVPTLGRDFPDTLRNALRCDPDVIMVGEVRDELTAEISMRAAISGHLLLTTLHAMEASAGPIQLIRMGVPAYQVADALRVVVAQRLVRLLCPTCKQPEAPQPEDLMALGYDADSAAALVAQADQYQFHTHNPDGCAECTRGYRGRTALAEVLIVGDMEKELLMSPERSATALRRLAISRGMKTLAQDGVEKAAYGQTSLTELRRVVA